MSRLQRILGATQRWLWRICVVTGIPGALLWPFCWWIWGGHSYALAVPGILLIVALVTGAYAVLCRSLTHPRHTPW